MLSVEKHERDAANLKYVYPVLSRRAGGVSLGINLNTNRACNWACVYCQVENLKRGNPESVDFLLLEKELRFFLQSDFLEKNAPQNAVLKDIAFSGDGEPTALPDFEQAVLLVCKIKKEFHLNHIKLRLITNGSFLDKAHIVKALPLLDEIWFKIDRADSSMKAINGVPFDALKMRHRLECAIESAPTFIQTCWFLSTFAKADDETLRHYIDFLKPYAARLKGIYLYGLARQSAQKQAPFLKRMNQADLNQIAQQIQTALHLNVQVMA